MMVILLVVWRFVKRVAFPSIVALVGAFAGLWVSVYSSELKSAFAQIATNGSFAQATEPHVLIAAALFIGFFVIFAAQQQIQNSASNEAQRELIAETTVLRVMVADLKTLPPEGFLQSFQESFLSVGELMLFTRPLDTGRVDHDDMIRSVLLSIATLARHYDRQPEGVLYSANVMVYWSNESLRGISGTGRANELLDVLRFSDGRDEHFSSGNGLLELIPSLAAGADGEVHAALLPLALPVSHSPTVRLMVGDKFNVLPGAPFAIALGRYAHYDSIDTMLKWCRDEADISQSVQEQLRMHFHNGQGQDIRSFLSIPLAAGGTPIGVLNVQASASRMLYHGGTLRFVPVVTPLVSLLTYLVGNWVVERERSYLTGPKQVSAQAELK